MKPVFSQLPQEKREELQDLIYTGTLAISLLFLQNLISATPSFFVEVALANFAISIPALACAILSRRIFQRSTPADAVPGIFGLISTTLGIGASLQHFTAVLSSMFSLSVLLATYAFVAGYKHYVKETAVNQPEQETSQPEHQPGNRQARRAQQKKKPKPTTGTP